MMVHEEVGRGRSHMGSKTPLVDNIGGLITRVHRWKVYPEPTLTNRNNTFNNGIHCAGAGGFCQACQR